MLYYHFFSAIEGGYGDEVPAFTQITSKAPAAVNLVAQFWWSAVPVWAAGAAEVGERGVDPDG